MTNIFMTGCIKIVTHDFLGRPCMDIYYFSIFFLFITSGSSKRTLCLDVWSTFMSCIGCVPTSENEKQTPSKGVLGDEQVMCFLVLSILDLLFLLLLLLLWCFLPRKIFA